MPQDVIASGHRAFREVIKVKWTPNWYDWFRHKQRSLGCRYTQKKDHVNTRGRGSPLQDKDRGLRVKLTLLILAFQPPEL